MDACPAAPGPIEDVFMPDDYCMIQVCRMDAEGYVMQAWTVQESMTDVCEKMTALYGAPLGGSTGTLGAMEHMYSEAQDRKNVGEVQIVNYDA